MSMDHVTHSKDDDADGEQTYRSEPQYGQQKEQQQDKERKQRTQSKAKLEPSLKWKALGLDSDQTSYVALFLSCISPASHLYLTSISHLAHLYLTFITTLFCIT